MKRKEGPTPIPVADEHDIMKITPLGGINQTLNIMIAGNEVGRSCIVIEFKQKKIMLDCGLHPGLQGLSALPFFDEIDPAEIDLLLVSHFHIDHAASVPYFMQKTAFKGRVFMTHPTRAIYKWMLSDYVKVSNLSTDDQLYTEQDLLQSFERIEVMDYHQEVQVDGIRFTSYNAGHVLGAAMFLIEIAGVRVLYTGDYSREEDRHLMAAERPKNVVPEVLICESTYGVQSHQPRVEREAMFTSMVHRVVGQGGRCLIPVFALGRAQELLLILDEYWQAHPELHNVPIYYASSLAKKCMTVYQTYTNMMNERIKKQIKVSNPFLFKHISNLKSIGHFDDVGPCVMMASPGMLQSGLSRELLELWAPDKRNGVIIPGYVVDGTLAKLVLSQPAEIPTMNGGKIALNLSVEYISFSAHVDYQQNSQFIQEVASPNLILVHGDSNEMGRLKSALDDKYLEADTPLTIYTPRNCEVVELYFRGEKMAKTLGSLAQIAPVQDAIIDGILVSRDFQYNIIAPSDLAEYTHDHLNTTRIDQRQSVPCRAPFSLIKWHLEMMYGSVVDMGEPGYIRVFDTVDVRVGKGSLMIEWEGNGVNDMIADSVLAVVLQAESSPASVKVSKSAHDHHGHSHETKEEKPVKIKIEDETNDESTSQSPLVIIDTDIEKSSTETSIESDLVKKDQIASTDETIDTPDNEKSNARMVFAFYATLLLSCQFSPENIEYIPSPSVDISQMTQGVVESMGREYEEVMHVLEQSLDISEEVRASAMAFKSQDNGEEEGERWVMLIDTVLVTLVISFTQTSGLAGVFVDCTGNPEIGKRVMNVGTRISKSLLPITHEHL